MFCDDVASLDASERSRYADLLVLIAAADGELVREEIQVLEGLMGRAMVHPEARTSIRKGLHDPHRLDDLVKLLGCQLRDALAHAFGEERRGRGLLAGRGAVHRWVVRGVGAHHVPRVPRAGVAAVVVERGRPVARRARRRVEVVHDWRDVRQLIAVRRGRVAARVHRGGDARRGRLPRGEPIGEAGER